MQCSSNLKQVSLALNVYATAFGHLPSGRLGDDDHNSSIYYGMSGLVAILPQLDQQALYDLFDYEKSPWSGDAATWLPTNFAAIQQRPAVYVCPSDESEPFSEDPTVNTGDPAFKINSVNPDAKAATGSYALVAGTNGASISTPVKRENNGVFFYMSVMPLSEVTDGLNSTMFAGEVVEAHTPNSSNIWSRALREMDCHRSTNNPLNVGPGDPDWPHIGRYGLVVNGTFGSRHPGGANFTFGDGHVEFLSENISIFVYQSLSTRAGGEGQGGGMGGRL
jgi:prepilin-type processing-associated H-X9-DG protein